MTPDENWKKELDALLEDYDRLEIELRHKRDTIEPRSLVDYENIRKIDKAIERIHESRWRILENNPWYRRDEPEPPKETGPGLLGSILKGIKETAEFGLGHPYEAAGRIAKGARELVSIPFRAAETVVTGGGEFPSPIPSAKRYERMKAEEQLASERAAGVSPESVGPAVAEAVGTAVIPVGPTIKAGEALKNILKGGAFTSGIYAGERLAEGEPVDLEGTGAAFAIGGGLSGLLGKLLGKQKPPAAKPPEPKAPEPKAPETKAPEPTKMAEPEGPRPEPAIKVEPGEQLPLPGIRPAGEPAVQLDLPFGEGGTRIDVDQLPLPFGALKKVIKRAKKEPEVNYEPGTPMGDALAGIQQELALQKAAKKKPVEKKAAVEKPSVEKQRDEAIEELGKFLKGEKTIEQIKPAKEPKKVEAPVGEPATGAAKPVRLEDFISQKKLELREREPFPGEIEYDVLKKGVPIARGDREQLLNALQQMPEAKGLKLYSFPAGVGDLAESLMKRLREVGARLPEDVEVKGPQHKSGLFHEALRPLERPQFHWRGSPAGSMIEDAAVMAERGIDRRYRDLLYVRDPEGNYHDTGFFRYLSLPKESKDRVNKVLVFGDHVGEDYSNKEGNAMLAKLGLSVEEIDAYNGVRRALDDIIGWVREELKHRISPDDLEKLKEIDSSYVKGYIPHVWGGRWEIFINGIKYLRDDGSSSFPTLQKAIAEVYELKKLVPKAKIEIVHFADEQYVRGRALEDARLLRRLKANMERLGSIDAGLIDEAYKMGRDLKGFARHLIKRKGEGGYDIENLDEVLQAYAYKAAKFVEISKMRRVVDEVFRDHTNDLTADQIAYLKHYVERVAGKPAADQVMIENYINRTPLGRWLAPGFSSRAVKTAEQLTTHLSLGMFNIAWAAVNIDSLLRHTWPGLARELAQMPTGKTAEDYLLDAIKTFFKDKKLVRRLAHEGAIDIQFLTEPLPTLKPHIGRWTPARVSLILGTATEEFNRGVTAIARYKMALDQGLAESEAIHAASRFVDFTQGRYTTAGKPLAFTGLSGRMIGQFKTFMVAMLENGWVNMQQPGSAIRYIMATLGLSGIAGLPFVDDLDSFITSRFGWSPKEAAEKAIPDPIMRGLVSFLPEAVGLPAYNIDMSRKAGYPDIIPNDTMSALGPIVSRFGGAVVSVLNGETEQAVDKLLPSSLRPIVQLKRGEDIGMPVGATGRPISRLSPEEKLVRAAGFTPLQMAKEEELYARNLAKIEYMDRRKHQLAKLIAQGKATPEDFQEYALLGGTARGIRSEAQAEQLPMLERQFRHLPRILRRDPASFATQ